MILLLTHPAHGASKTLFRTDEIFECQPSHARSARGVGGECACSVFFFTLATHRAGQTRRFAGGPNRVRILAGCARRAALVRECVLVLARGTRHAMPEREFITGVAETVLH